MRPLAVLATLPAPADGPLTHFFRSALGEHVLVVPYSRIFDLPAGASRGAVEHQLRESGWLEARAGEVALDAVVAPEPQAVSLNVSSSCNLACSYCYASRGGFAGQQSGRMDEATATRAVDRLLAVADPSRPITIGFLGGEPFLARPLLWRVVEHAEAEARARRLDVRFSVTTNGTLLTESDVDALRRRRFAVTVSIDGPASVQDVQRPRSLVRGSFRDIEARLRSLLEDPGQAQLAARATVMSPFSDLKQRFDALLDLGFPEVGFSPLRHAPEGHRGELRGSDWIAYLRELSSIGRSEAERLRSGAPIRLTNLAVALKQLGRGASSPYPCGAGGGYFSVAADGRWFACHRAVGQPEYQLGDSEGLDAGKRARFLSARHVHAQPECRACFARYLCSGGCHQEASTRDESSCGFIRGWLEFCLALYCELGSEPPTAQEESWPRPHHSS